MPLAFVAEILTWYSVLAVRPAAMDADTNTLCSMKTRMRLSVTSQGWTWRSLFIVSHALDDLFEAGTLLFDKSDEALDAD